MITLDVDRTWQIRCDVCPTVGDGRRLYVVGETEQHAMERAAGVHGWTQRGDGTVVCRVCGGRQG